MLDASRRLSSVRVLEEAFRMAPGGKVTGNTLKRDP
jgi:hypothetical protein